MTATAPRTVVSVDFRENRAPRATVAPKGRIPRVARLLALTHRIDRMVREGAFRDLADAARAMGVTRARVTQVVNLTLLAPEIQDAVLNLPLVTNGRDPVSERQLRAIVAEPVWDRQIEMWEERHGMATILPNRDGA